MSSDDTLEEAADAAEDVDDPEGSKTYSYAYLTALFLGLAAAIAGAVYVGILDPQVQVTATLSVGWILEYSAAGLAGLFLFWTASHIINVVGMGFISSLLGAIARVADAYQLPEQSDDE